MRYYTGFGLFGLAEFGYGKSKIYNHHNPIPTGSGFIGQSYKLKYKMLAYSAGLGYSFQLKPNLRIEPIMKYIHVKYDTKTDKNEDFKRNGFLLNIGFAYYF